MPLHYIILPITSTILGGLATYAILKLLFLPRQPLKIGRTIQLGILQRCWPLFVSEVMQIIKHDVLSKDSFDKLLTQNDLEQNILPLLEKHMDAFIDNMKRKNPMIGMFLSDQLLFAFKGQAHEEFVKMLPEFKKVAATQLVNSPQLMEHIEKKVRFYDLNRLEKRVWSKTALTLVIGGALVGLLIGLLQIVLLAWLG